MNNLENKHGSGCYKTAIIFDVAKQGVYYEKQTLKGLEDYRSTTSLRVTGEPYFALRRSHLLNSEDLSAELENLLKHNISKSRMGETVFVIGYHSDPFSVYKQKYANTLKLLELFAKYRPGKLILQTYSHLIVLAVTKLLPLKSFITINMCIETCDEDIAGRYSPGTSGIEDRFKAAAALKHFGFDVEIQVAPLLPYEGGERIAEKFADKLAKSCNRVFIAPITAQMSEHEQKTSPLIYKLVEKEYGSWIRPGSERELKDILSANYPNLLQQPEGYTETSKQLGLFVA